MNIVVSGGVKNFEGVNWAVIIGVFIDKFAETIKEITALTPTSVVSEEQRKVRTQDSILQFFLLRKLMRFKTFSR